MYAGCESIGGPCKLSMRPRTRMDVKLACAADVYWIADNCNCGEIRTECDGEVPFLEQFNAQQRRADADSAVWDVRSAVLQQSMSPISPPIGHDCSPECVGIGTPATALPATISKSTRAVSRILINLTQSMENSQFLSSYSFQRSLYP
jgi:hypothetical protein